YRLGGRLAWRGIGRARDRCRWPHRSLPLSRSIVAELAGARACRDRQHRSGLPADQQVIQPELFGARSLMWKILRQIARTGIVTEPAPQIVDADSVAIQRIHQDILHILGQALTIRQVDAGSCNGCELEINALDNPYYNI